MLNRLLGSIYYGNHVQIMKDFQKCYIRLIDQGIETRTKNPFTFLMIQTEYRDWLKYVITGGVDEIFLKK